MATPALDLSAWPPALVFALVIIMLICKVLPDVLEIPGVLRPATPSSSSGSSR